MLESGALEMCFQRRKAWLFEGQQDDLVLTVFRKLVVNFLLLVLFADYRG